MKRVCALCLVFLLLLSGCAPAEAPPRLQVTAVVYPMAVAARAVCRDVPGVRVEQMAADTGGCVHDYNLSVRDLQKLEGADLLILSGAGLEDFMSGLLSRYPELTVCDAGAKVPVRALSGGHGHTHEAGEEDGGEETDPHLWMNPQNLILQTRAIAESLAERDPDYAVKYRENAEAFCRRLEEADRQLEALLSPLSCRELISFHEGFGYFGDRYGFSVTGIEEEAGGEASAQVLAELSEEIREEEIPAVFYEENGSDRSARVLSRECGVPACALSMLMDGDGTPESLLEDMVKNGEIIAEGYGS